MSDTNERSVASAGSHGELYRAVRALLDGVNARHAKHPREWTCPHMQALDDMTQSEPWPTLTDEEREAVAWASTVEWGSNPHAATLRGLLERLG